VPKERLPSHPLSRRGGAWRLFAYGALFCLICHLFVVGYEEPTLKESFGAEYEAFRINVPRWIPRLTAWRGGR
jgi:protein-S-isoprenylcysteine O-methyltransferase Ste14